MPTKRTAHDAQFRLSAPIDKAACLDCPDCNGACWSVVELALIPDRVLHADRTA